MTRPLAGRTVLVTRPADGSTELVKLLDRLGVRSIVAPAIEIVPARSAALTRGLRDLAGGRFAWITLTSASTVRGFIGAVGAVSGAPKVVCIGPVTAREARAHGLPVHAVARPHTIEGVAAAVERVLGSRRT